MERWMPVPSVPGLLASSLGRIMAEPREGKMPNGGARIYKGKAWLGTWRGARYVIFFRGRNYKVARLVCEAFRGPAPEGKPVCMHLDEDARNNRPENLCWGSQRENLNAPGFIAYCKSRTGENSPFIKGRAKTQA
jgi:hypothetical protein